MYIFYSLEDWEDHFWGCRCGSVREERPPSHQKEKKGIASAGNRTRASRVAGGNHTTRQQTLYWSNWYWIVPKHYYHYVMMNFLCTRACDEKYPKITKNQINFYFFVKWIGRWERFFVGTWSITYILYLSNSSLIPPPSFFHSSAHLSLFSPGKPLTKIITIKTISHPPSPIPFILSLQYISSSLYFSTTNKW